MTGKLPYLTYQYLKANKVPMDQWPEYVKKAYSLRQRKRLGKDMVNSVKGVAPAYPGHR